MKRFVMTATATVVLASSTIATAQDIVPPPPAPPIEKTTGSLYLQCDGNPNNMSAGEGIARFLGAVTLLGLFAPAVESPSPAARLFGERGVAACSKLIVGEAREGLPARRLPLILGRALHRIEAGDYRNAVADVTLARQEAVAAGLSGNPYFDRSLGISFDMIEAEALFAAGDYRAARAVSLRRGTRYQYSYYPLIAAEAYRPVGDAVDPLEVTIALSLGRMSRGALMMAVNTLEEAGRFADAVAVLRDFTGRQARFFPKDLPASLLTAKVAVDLALAGQWDAAATEATSARAQLDAAETAGKPDPDRSATIELLDYHRLLAAAHQGRWDEAWRSYTARSEWSVPTFGQQAGALALLEPHRPAGVATASVAELRARRRDAYIAARRERYKDNKFPWTRILPYASPASYERMSKSVWNSTKAPFVSKQVFKDSDAFILSVDGDPLTQSDGAMLHAALVAKARGHRGFEVIMLPTQPGTGFIRFVAAGATDVGPANATFIDADAVIAELKDIIPGPQELERRRAAESAAQKKRK